MEDPMRENQGTHEQDPQRRPSDQNIGAQQRHDRGSDGANPPDPLEGPEGRDVPPSAAPRDPTSPWMGGG
jgi:hypothetical protein